MTQERKRENLSVNYSFKWAEVPPVQKSMHPLKCYPSFVLSCFSSLKSCLGKPSMLRTPEYNLCIN